jgi:SNF2 family DNA or RNA helicase
MGTGVNGMQTKSCRAYFVEFDWSPAVNQQAEARLQRLGQVNPVTIDYVVGQDGLDTYILETVLTKLNIIAQILGEGEDHG